MGEQQGQQSAHRRHDDVAHDEQRPFTGTEHGVQDDVDQRDSNGQHQHQPLVRPLLALVFSGPIDTVAGGKLDSPVNLSDSLFHGTPEITPADTVFDRDIALVLFPVNLLSPILYLYLGQLRKRDSFSGRSKQTNVFDGFLGVTIGLLIAGHEVIASFPLQYLADGASADRGLDGVLYVTDIDTVTRRRPAVDHVIEIGLANHPENPEVLDTRNLAHDAHNLVSSGLQFPQVIAVELDRQLAFHAADCFLNVVRDGLREVPHHARHLFQFAIHGPDQFILILVEG